MRWRIFILALLACTAFGSGLETHAPTQELLARKPILLTGGGRVAIPFEDALHILGRKDMLTAIQRSYAAVLPEGEVPDESRGTQGGNPCCLFVLKIHRRGLIACIISLNRCAGFRPAMR